MADSETQVQTRCPHCGAVVAEVDSRFCTSCGATLQGPAPAATTPQAAPGAEKPVSAAAAGKDAVRPPEIGFIYAQLLTSIAGAAFWSRNWVRLGYPQHRLWTWLSAVAVLILQVWAALQSGGFLLDVLIGLVWQITVFRMQRKLTPAEVRSPRAFVIAAILLAVTLVSGLR